MKTQRAQAILNAADTIQVELDGASVWIDSVDPDNGTAKVHSVTQPDEEKTVKVEQLREA